MGFYVPTNRDVKFPKACEQCHFYDGLLCCVMDTYVHDPENKHEECPLIEIPDNHGRLIDADALAHDLDYDVEINQRALDEMNFVGKERERVQFDKDCKQNCMWYLSNAPTVIPADEMI